MRMLHETILLCSLAVKAVISGANKTSRVVSARGFLICVCL